MYIATTPNRSSPPANLLLAVGRPVLFADADQAAAATRDPVAPAKRSAGALRKVHAKVLDAGTPIHRLQTLLKARSTLVRNVSRRRGAGPAVDEPPWGSASSILLSLREDRIADLLKEDKFTGLTRDIPTKLDRVNMITVVWRSSLGMEES